MARTFNPTDISLQEICQNSSCLIWWGLKASCGPTRSYFLYTVPECKQEKKMPVKRNLKWSRAVVLLTHLNVMVTKKNRAHSNLRTSCFGKCLFAMPFKISDRSRGHPWLNSLVLPTQISKSKVTWCDCVTTHDFKCTISALCLTASSAPSGRRRNHKLRLLRWFQRGGLKLN